MIESSKACLCWPNRADQGVITSTGDWDTDFPLSNLQSYLIPVVARTDAETTTQITLTIPPQEIGSVALAGHNLTSTSTWRIRFYSDSGLTTMVYDSGSINAFDVAPDDAEILPALSYHIADDNYTVEAIVIDIVDTSNGDGYIEIGRLFAARVFQAEVNIVNGYQDSLLDTTEVQTAIDGITDYFDERVQRRTATMTFPMLSREEAYLQIKKMQMTLGRKGEVLFAKDATGDSTERFTTFLANMQQFDPIQQPYFNRHTAPLSLLEKR